MHYRYSAQEQFEFTKAFLKNPAEGASSRPRSLLDAMNYGSHFPGFDTRIKFYSKQVGSLRVGATPLYLSESGSLNPPPAKKEENQAMPAESASTQTPPRDVPSEPADAPSGQSSATAGLPPELAMLGEEPGVKLQKPRISTHVLSGLVGVSVAIVAGVMISSGSSFKLKTPAAATPAALTGSISNQENHVSPLPAMSTLPLEQEAPAAPALQALPGENAANLSANEPDAAKTMSASQPSLQGTPTLPAPDGKRVGTEGSRPKATPQAVRRAQNQKSIPPEPPGQTSADNSPVPAKKKFKATGSAKKPERAPKKPHSEQEPSYTAEWRPKRRSNYAQCEKVDGLFQRERCKWRVCNGRWGKNGCPSYQHLANPALGVGPVMADKQIRKKALDNL